MRQLEYLPCSRTVAAIVGKEQWHILLLLKRGPEDVPLDGTSRAQSRFSQTPLLNDVTRARVWVHIIRPFKSDRKIISPCETLGQLLATELTLPEPQVPHLVRTRALVRIPALHTYCHVHKSAARLHINQRSLHTDQSRWLCPVVHQKAQDSPRTVFQWHR